MRLLKNQGGSEEIKIFCMERQEIGGRENGKTQKVETTIKEG